MYEVIGFENVALDRLAPHPDAEKFTAGKDDRANLSDNLSESALRKPLLVVRSGEGFLVLDGIGRVESLRAKGKKSAPCNIVETDEFEETVDDCNAVGRKVTTGMRIIRKLWRHRYEVAESYEAGLANKGNGGLSHGETTPLLGKAKPEKFAMWDPELLAKELQVSKEDIKKSIALVRAMVRGTDPCDPDKELDVERRDKLTELFGKVRCGQTPIRKSFGAWKGKIAKQDSCGRDAVDLPGRAQRTSVALVGVFAQWTETVFLTDEQREVTVGKLFEAMRNMPEFMRRALVEIIAKTWTDAEKKNLAKAISSK